MNKWTRRAFIATGGVVGGGLAIGLAGVAFAPNRMSLVPEGEGNAPRLTTWIRLTPDNIVTAIVPHCEMGQGVHTALAMMLAEELEADWSLVRVEEAPADPAYANGYLAPVFVPVFAAPPRFMERSVDWLGYKLTQLMDLQVTGGSSSVRGTGRLGMRVAGAAAKAMLIEAAAKRWNVAAEECAARLSKITHTPTGRSFTFGELAAEAAKLDPPQRPMLKARETYSIVGKPTPRIDIPSKVNGSATYGIDVALPDMLYATIAAAPVFGAKLQSVDTQAAEALPGVKKIVQLDNAVAVVADSYWRALKALRALTPAFSVSDHNKASSDSIFAATAQALESAEAKEIHKAGDVDRMLGAATTPLAAEYRAPFLAHATMEPMNATARIADGKCEVWTGVQDPLGARKVAAQAAGFEKEQVVIHNQHLGGGFGRRLPGNFDYVDQAVRVAKELSPAPVKLIWSREEDTQHDFYRPAVLARMRGGLNAEGRPLVWSSRCNGLDGDGAVAMRIPYAIEHQSMHNVRDSHHIRKGAWRSVAHSEHGFFTESFIDEMAHAAGKDPFEFRRELLANAPRHRAVLEKAAWLAGWGAPPPAGRGRGIAIVESFGSIVAQVAEVAVIDGRIKVHRVCAAVDCGEVVNPDTAAAQIEGGVMFGLSAALFNEVTINEGRVVQSNFNDLPMPKLADAPSIVVEFLHSDGPMGGLGEPGVPPIAPAIANAVFAATGKRLRSMPLKV